MLERFLPSFNNSFAFFSEKRFFEIYKMVQKFICMESSNQQFKNCLLFRCRHAVDRDGPRVVPRRKEGLPTTHQETKYAHFPLLSNWLRLCINIYPIKYTYIQLNLSNRKPLLMSCLFTGCIKKGNRTSARYCTWITRRKNKKCSYSKRSGF
jgi:hypothetical protein